MYKTFSMELAGRTLSVDIGRVLLRQMALHLCAMVIQLSFLRQQHPRNQERELISSH